VGRRFVIILLLVVPVLALRNASSPAVSRNPNTSRSSSRFALVGTSSCASAACHNQEVAGVRGREYAASLDDFAHGRAYQVLFGERSKQIERLYRGLPPNVPVYPDRDLLCAKCHVHPDLGVAPVEQVRFQLSDGVSCEACHGAAEKWLDRHHRSDWKRISADEKRLRYGMEDTRSIVGRARTCVRCHVGEKDADVTHDLIAAGHPRLAFEFTGYHSLMPKHWDDGLDRDPAKGGRRDFEIEAWALGQLVTFEASLDLLKHRRESKIWPEVAEFNCYACHHDLKKTGDKQERGFPGRQPGQLPWNTWGTCQLDTALELLGVRKGATPELDALRREMSTLKARPQQIDRALGELATLLEDIRSRGSVSRSPRELMAKSLMSQRVGPDLSWDEAAQVHNAVRAAEQARIDLGQPMIPGLRDALFDLRRALLPGQRYRLDDARTPLRKLDDAINK
jgi:hypothetical protein